MLRIDHVRSVFESKCELAGLDKDTFKDKYESFSKVGDFMDKKMKLKKRLRKRLTPLFWLSMTALKNTRLTLP